jgi:hypothetical protein
MLGQEAFHERDTSNRKHTMQGYLEGCCWHHVRSLCGMMWHRICSWLSANSPRQTRWMELLINHYALRLIWMSHLLSHDVCKKAPKTPSNCHRTGDRCLGSRDRVLRARAVCIARRTNSYIGRVRFQNSRVENGSHVIKPARNYIHTGPKYSQIRQNRWKIKASIELFLKPPSLARDVTWRVGFNPPSIECCSRVPHHCSRG